MNNKSLSIFMKRIIDTIISSIAASSTKTRIYCILPLQVIYNKLIFIKTLCSLNNRTLSKGSDQYGLTYLTFKTAPHWKNRQSSIKVEQSRKRRVIYEKNEWLRFLIEIITQENNTNFTTLYSILSISMVNKRKICSLISK